MCACVHGSGSGGGVGKESQHPELAASLLTTTRRRTRGRGNRSVDVFTGELAPWPSACGDPNLSQQLLSSNAGDSRGACIVRRSDHGGKTEYL